MQASARWMEESVADAKRTTFEMIKYRLIGAGHDAPQFLFVLADERVIRRFRTKLLNEFGEVQIAGQYVANGTVGQLIQRRLAKGLSLFSLLLKEFRRSGFQSPLGVTQDGLRCELETNRSAAEATQRKSIYKRS